MTKVIVELEKRVEYLESKKRLLLQTNEEHLQRSRLARILPTGAKTLLVDSVPSDVIGIAAKVEDAIHKWCGKKFFLLTHYGKQIERDWTNHEETGLEGSVERQDGSKIVPYFWFVP